MKRFLGVSVLGLLLYGCATTYDTSFAECIEGDCTNGQGTYTWASGEFAGDKYVGEWKDGKRRGRGTYTYADGTVEKGIWKNGEFVK